MSANPLRVVSTNSGLTICERVDGVTTLLLNRLERSNALTPELATDLQLAMERASGNASLRVLVIRGAGSRSFCGGYDLHNVTTGVRDDALGSMLRYLRTMPVPTVAVLNGHAVGAGLDLASSCDLRIARTGAKIGLPAVRIGVAYDAVGLRGILARTGVARRFLLTGELVDVAEAVGFADLVCAADSLDEQLEGIVMKLLAGSPASLEYMSAMIRPYAMPDVSADADWRNRVLDGPDAAAAAEARSRGTSPIFRQRDVSSSR